MWWVAFPASSCATFTSFFKLLPFFLPPPPHHRHCRHLTPLPPFSFIPRTPSHYDHSPSPPTLFNRTTRGAPTARLKWTETVSRTWDSLHLTFQTSQMVTTTLLKSFMQEFFPQKSSYGTNFWITILLHRLMVIVHNRGCIKLLALQICGHFAHLLLSRRQEHCCMAFLQDLALALILQI